MRVALAVNRITVDTDTNLKIILNMVNEAADNKADLVVFGEAALTGLINNDDPSHDLPLGQPIPGPVTDMLLELTRERRVWLAIGMLEREGHSLYDSAVLLTPGGEIGLKYRRIQPQWHGRSADPFVYRQGTELSKVVTPLGSFAFLICGDLWDDELVRRTRELRPDWLLYLVTGSGVSEERWEREDKPDYAQRAKLTGATTLMTGYIADFQSKDREYERSLGGAMVISSDGTVLASLPPGKAGILLVNL
jgi:N-carbamoylputrescine amidase